jgi:hypothetical protein
VASGDPLSVAQASWVRAHREAIEEELRSLEAQQVGLEELAPQARAAEWREAVRTKLAGDRERLEAVRAAWERATAAADVGEVGDA